MQTKQHAMIKKAFLLKKKEDLQGTFLWWKDFEQKMFNVQNLPFLLFNKLELHSIYHYFLRSCFSYALGLFETGYK